VSLTPQSPDDWENHWATFGDAARGNPANIFRTNIIVDLLGNLGGDDRLIDIGCGEGDLLTDMHERFPATQLLGVDISHEGINRARALIPTAEFLQVDLLAPKPELAQYETWATHGVCSEVLEHLDDPTPLLANARSLLAPGSPIVITVPAGPRSQFDLSIGHRPHFTPQRLRKVVEDAGLEVKLIRRAGFPFFTLYRLTVIGRGKRLLQDVQVKEDQEMSLAVRFVLGFYRVLFRFNLRSAPFGWQLIALVQVPAR
jgi:SAM-dependent methyltransferase